MTNHGLGRVEAELDAFVRAKHLKQVTKAELGALEDRLLRTANGSVGARLFSEAFVGSKGPRVPEIWTFTSDDTVTFGTADWPLLPGSLAFFLRSALGWSTIFDAQRWSYLSPERRAAFVIASERQ